VVENGGRACKNPWQLARGKWFLVRSCWLLWGKMYPAGRRSPWRGKIPEADSSGRAAPDPVLCRRRCRDSAGLVPEGRHLVLLVVDAQREVVQGAANDGVGAILQRLERRYVAVPPHEHCWCADEVIGQLRQRQAGSGGVVSIGKMFSSTQCLKTCSR
jgi:hypothetical protein